MSNEQDAQQYEMPSQQEMFIRTASAMFLQGLIEKEGTSANPQKAVDLAFSLDEEIKKRFSKISKET